MNLNHLCMGCMDDKGDGEVCPECGWKEETDDVSPGQLPPGTVLADKYLLGRVLGQGGFGITYLARDINLERKTAIKEYFPRDIAVRSTDRASVSLYKNEARSNFDYGLKKFLKEGKALATFHDHPGIISVLDSFKANGTGYIVMEYVDGITFKEYLEQEGGKISYKQALKILVPVMDSLREIHKAGLLHRDISPDNIYISEKGQVKLLDFGAARFAMGEHSKSLSVILKDGYAPEEQYRSKGEQGPWTDIYALGATFYRAITGKVPLQALDRKEKDELQPPSAFGVDIPPEVQKELMKALAVKVKDRPKTVQEFQDILMKEEKRKIEIEAKRKKKEVKAGGPVIIKSFKLWIAAAAVFFLAALVFFIFWLNAQNEITSLKVDMGSKKYLALKFQKESEGLGEKIGRQEEKIGRLEEEIKEVEKKFENERELRERLVEDGPLTVTGIRVRNLNGKTLGDFNTRFKKGDIRYICFNANFKSNWSGIKNIEGKLYTKYIKPGGTYFYNDKSPIGYTLYLSIEVSDAKEVNYCWGDPDRSIYQAGTHRIELWWDGKKIGETKFEVYE